MILPRTAPLLSIFAFTFLFNLIFMGHVTGFDSSIPAFADSYPINNTSNFTDQLILLKNLASNQSSDLKEIKELLSQEVELHKEEVELLKNIGEGFKITATHSQFATLGVFFMGTALAIYGMRLAVKATDRRTSRYLKAMVLVLIIPVIVLLTIYQIGIPIYEANDPFFLISILLIIPVVMIVFLLIAESRLMASSNQKDQ